MTRPYSPHVLLGVALALAACGGSAKQATTTPEEAGFELGSERANPYRFQRSVALTLLRTGQPEEATRVIRRLISLRPDEVEPYYLLGRAFVETKQYEAAEKTLNEALSLDAKYAPAHAMLGVLLDTVGRSGEAERCHARAVALAPKDAGYHNNLGFSLYLRGAYRRALDSYKLALELDPTAHRVHNNVGFAYAKLGRLDEAEAHFKLGGPPAQASTNMGFVHEERGEDELAYQRFVLAVSQDPLLVPARDNLERICARLGRELPALPSAVPLREAQDPTATSMKQPTTQEASP